MQKGNMGRYRLEPRRSEAVKSRNEAIMADLHEGMPRRAIAEKYGISKQYAHRLILNLIHEARDKSSV